MRSNLIRDLLSHLHAKGLLVTGRCADRIAAQIENLGLPPLLTSILKNDWPTKQDLVGGYSLLTVQEILASRDLNRLRENEMLPIGSAANGDLLVLNLRDDRCEVGLISHDSFWENQDIHPLQAYVRISDSLEEYLYKAIEGKYLPIDYYAACEWRELRASLQND